MNSSPAHLRAGQTESNTHCRRVKAPANASPLLNGGSLMNRASCPLAGIVKLPERSAKPALSVRKNDTEAGWLFGFANARAVFRDPRVSANTRPEVSATTTPPCLRVKTESPDG